MARLRQIPKLDFEVDVSFDHLHQCKNTLQTLTHEGAIIKRYKRLFFTFDVLDSTGPIMIKLFIVTVF